MSILRGTLVSLMVVAVFAAGSGRQGWAVSPQPPNILFVIMDDVGIDQMRIFGYGGTEGGSGVPRTPNIDTIARAGVRFRNAWAMPECSPSRALLFEGRYPFRTNIYTALTKDDLANSQVSPFETTTPKLLATAGYESALFGKFHIAGPDNNPFGERTPRALGWDYFYGFMRGAPNPIDTTAGGLAPTGTYGCGFVPDLATDAVNGADFGACYFTDASCVEMTVSPGAPAPGFSCLQQGGIFVREARCQDTLPFDPANFCPPGQPVDFDDFQDCAYLNAYYVSPLVVIDGDAPTRAETVRTYRTQLETDGAIDWITRRPHRGPWMATVSYSSDHSPYQQPPPVLLTAGSRGDNSSLDCTSPTDQKTLSDQMIEALDHEVGRLLVDTGLATRRPDGGLDYHPERTNTVLVILGDNGSYAPVVKPPFNPARAKGYTYQTGAWVPLIVAGPLVESPDREVGAMVNAVDLFALFAEVAGVDFHKAVPKSHHVDAESMLPYLSRPNTPSIRKTNVTQTGNNIEKGFVLPGPCVIPLSSTVNVCVQQFATSELCSDEGGTWKGDTYQTCCQVQQNEYSMDDAFAIVPDFATAIRNDRYKLVVSEVPDCTAAPDANPPVDKSVSEFYEIDEAAPKPKLDNREDNLLLRATLTPQERNNLNALKAALEKLLASEPHLSSNASYAGCPGDGNLDLVVDSLDVDNWRVFAALDQARDGQSSWYDFNFDGRTDVADRHIIEQNFGRECRTMP